MKFHDCCTPLEEYTTMPPSEKFTMLPPTWKKSFLRPSTAQHDCARQVAVPTGAQFHGFPESAYARFARCCYYPSSEPRALHSSLESRPMRRIPTVVKCCCCCGCRIVRGNEGNLLLMDPQTGELRLNSTLDRNQRQYSLTMLIEVSGGVRSEITATVSSSTGSLCCSAAHLFSFRCCRFGLCDHCWCLLPALK